MDEPIMSKGIVSKIVNCDGIKLIQTDCKIFNGYSGGGIFNKHFELCGIIIYNVKHIEEGIIIQNINFSYGIEFL